MAVKDFGLAKAVIGAWYFPAQTSHGRPLVVCFNLILNFDIFGKYLNESCGEYSLE